MGPYVKPGMNVLDIGCAMGFFSLPLAEMVGAAGKVICVDVEERMLNVLKKRVAKAGLTDRIDARPCPPNSLAIDDYAERMDVALAMFVVHEVPDSKGLLREVAAVLRPGGVFVVAEPKAHVSKAEFEGTLNEAHEVGFEILEERRIFLSRCSVLRKRGAPTRPAS